MSGEEVRNTLELLLHNWDRAPVRVWQDGAFRMLFLSEIRDPRTVALMVCKLIADRHGLTEPDMEEAPGDSPGA